MYADVFSINMILTLQNLSADVPESLMTSTNLFLSTLSYGRKPISVKEANKQLNKQIYVYK